MKMHMKSPFANLIQNRQKNMKNRAPNHEIVNVYLYIVEVLVIRYIIYDTLFSSTDEEVVTLFLYVRILHLWNKLYEGRLDEPKILKTHNYNCI